MLKFFLSILYILTISPLLSFDSDEIKVSSETREIVIGKYGYFYEDKENSFDFQSISSPAFQDKFEKHNDDNLNFGYSSSTFWVRFNIQNSEPENKDYLIEISNPHLDYIDFYYNKNNSWIKKELGDHFPFPAREVYNRNFVIPVELRGKSQNTFYFRIKTSGLSIINFTLYSNKEFIHKTTLYESWYSLFYGIMLVMFLYNGFIALTFRSLTYVLYCMSTLFLSLFYLSYFGHGYQYLWPNSSIIQNYMVLTSTVFGWVFILAFTNRFLHLKQQFPFYSKLILYLQIYFASTLIVLFFSKGLCGILQNFGGVANSLLVFFIGVHSWYSGNRPARFFVLAWITFLIGAVLFTLYIINFLSHNFFTNHTIQIGSVLELILLSFALSDRYKAIIDHNILMKQDLLDYQLKINDTLENKVKERTAELNKSLHLIKDDLAMAKKIQAATLSSNLKVNPSLEIVAKYIAMSEVGGDYFSVDKLDETITRIFIADATGHGVQAALIMMAIQGIYDSIKNFALPANDILEIFNKEFMRRYGTLNSFITCILLEIDSSKKQLTYSSAGHPPGALIKEKEIIYLSKTGPLVGLSLSNTYGMESFPFDNEDRLYAFTDGVFEQFKGKEEFGEERLISILSELKSVDIKTSINSVLKELDSFLDGTPRQDDITIIGITYSKK